MTIAFIGIGNVGFALANNLQKKGHDIIVANNNLESKSVKNALEKNFNFKVMIIKEAVNASDLIFLATPFSVNENILKNLNFNDKILVDCTNPVGSAISHGLESKVSGAEKVQEWAKTAKVVKAFTIYGYENFQNASFTNYKTKPVMLVAGNDYSSKISLKPIIKDLGFFMKDTGKLDQALHLEHMTLLWVKMVRRDGHHPNFTWAYLEK